MIYNSQDTETTLSYLSPDGCIKKTGYVSTTEYSPAIKKERTSDICNNVYEY